MVHSFAHHDHLSNDDKGYFLETSYPDQFFTGRLIYNHTILGQQPAALRGSENGSSCFQGHMPYVLPKNKPGIPESLSVHVRFSMKQNGKRCKVSSSRTQCLYHTLMRGATTEDLAMITLGLWTSQGPRGETPEDKQPNSVQFNHKLWQTQVAVSMIPTKSFMHIFAHN